jgi:hypothetical protein
MLITSVDADNAIDIRDRYNQSPPQHSFIELRRGFVEIQKQTTTLHSTGSNFVSLILPTDGVTKSNHLFRAFMASAGDTLGGPI